MSALFTAQYQWLWTLVLAAALFIPVRQLIWVLSVRRAEGIRGERTDEETRRRLKRRAGFTAALLCLAFSFFYVDQLLRGG